MGRRQVEGSSPFPALVNGVVAGRGNRDIGRFEIGRIARTGPRSPGADHGGGVEGGETAARRTVE